MPMYEYQCQDCGMSFEEIAGRDEAVACPSCGTTNTSRQLSAPSLKTGAAPFKVGPVRPMAPKRSGGCPGGSCGGCGGSTSLG